MNERIVIGLSSMAAIVCAICMFYVMHQINETRMALQEDGIDIFNYVMQNDRNTDRFAYDLLDYQQARLRSQDPDDGVANASETLDKSAYLESYDILYSVFRFIDDMWLGTHRELPQAQAVVQEGRQFIDEIEPLMNNAVTLSDERIVNFVQRAKALSNHINELGHWHYQNMSRKSDAINLRLNSLTQAFWFFGISLVLAGMVLLVLLNRAGRRVAAFYSQSRFAQDQLTKALEELTSGDNERRAQNRFIAAASHDLRQPLHALGLYLTALRGHVKTEKGIGILDSVHRSSEALNQLLNSLLDISKLDAGVVDIDERPFSLDALLEQLHQTFQPDAEERGLQLDVELDDLWVRTDRVLLDRILRNLLSNALTYTRAGGVSISATAEQQHVFIQVHDTGLGIPAIEQQAVFNEYYQLNNPERDRSKGLGLGLSIVKRLTRLLELELRVESQHGRGSVFEVRVPRASAPPRTEQRVIAHNTNDRMVLDGLTILVIDDEKDIRDGMAALFSTCGSEVILADSAAQATDQLIRNDTVPDLILADYRLRDDQTGDRAIEIVRDEINEDVPAIIITGDTSPERLKEATASGFKLLHKPVVAEEMFAAIRRLVEVEAHENTAR